MTDFTSSLYLGMKHGSDELKGWSQLTTGLPAALSEYNLSGSVGDKIAAMQGLEKGLVATSTLHLYWDLFGMLSKMKITIFIDEKVYPVSRYGIERLQAKNLRIVSFRHMELEHVIRLLKTSLAPNTQAVIITDGWCPVCGKAAKLEAYSRILEPYNGTLIVDDTQALGIFGTTMKGNVYGEGGGGTLRWQGCNKPVNVVSITSLAKAFGAPIAVMSGTRSFMQKFEANSLTRVNSSAPSIPNIHAAENAIKINISQGAERRKKLSGNLLLFKSGLKQLKGILSPHIFPFQKIACENPGQTLRLFNMLEKNDFRTVLIKQHENKDPAIGFIIRSDHQGIDIRRFAGFIGNAYSLTSKQIYYEDFIG